MTIGIPIYNNAKDLRGCLESIQRNVTLDVELVLVDDKSTQDIRGLALEFVQKSAGHVKSVVYIRNKKNRGFPHNANVILDQATHDTVCVLNSDTYVCPGALERLDAALRAEPLVMIAGPTTSSANSIQQVYEYSKKTRVSQQNIVAQAQSVEQRFQHEVLELSQKETNSQVQGFCFCVKKEAIEKIGYFDEVYGMGTYEESDYNARADFLGFKAVWVKKAYVHHYGHASFKGSKAFQLLRHLLKNDKIWLNKIQHLTPENVKQVKRVMPDFTLQRLK